MNECLECPYSIKKSGSNGDPTSDFVIVGEGPGLDELKSGKAFTGVSGTFFFTHFKFPVKPYIINVVNCFGGKMKSPERTAKAMKSCHNRLMADIKQHPRKMILALGTPALQALTGTDKKILANRGKFLKSPLASVGILPTYHPAFLMRGGGVLKLFKSDLQYAWDLYSEGETKAFKEPRIQIINSEQYPTFHKKFYYEDKRRRITCDIETGGFDFQNDEFLCASLNKDPQDTYIITAEAIYDHQALWKEVMEDTRNVWTWQNGQFDIKFFQSQFGINARVDEDTMLLNYALNEHRGHHNLDQIASDVLDAPMHKGMLDKHKKKTESYSVIPKDILYHYAGMDGAKTHQIFRPLRDQVAADPKLELLYTQTLLPAVPYLVSIEHNGMLLNVNQVNLNFEIVGKECDELEKELQRIAKVDGFPNINPRSPLQLKKYLFEYLDLRVGNKKQTSTGVKVLEKLPLHPFVVALLKYRKKHKAFSTYIKPALTWASKDGRVHTSYNLAGTTTGRLASSDPNLQNIPREKVYRNMFMASPGYILVEVDLSQAELRSLAQLSGCKALSAIYLDNSMSLHDEVAIEIFGEDFTSEDKMSAKAVNFGIVYGRTAISLALEFDISLEEAQRWINTWLTRFPGAAKYIERCRRVPVVSGSMYTKFGRRRRFHFTTGMGLAAARNEAANFPHQSTAGDITLHAGIRTYKEIIKWDSKIVNTVHDSLILEVPMIAENIIGISNLVSKEMTRVPIDWGMKDIPFTTDTDIGFLWGELHALDTISQEVLIKKRVNGKKTIERIALEKYLSAHKIPLDVH